MVIQNGAVQKASWGQEAILSFVLFPNFPPHPLDVWVTQSLCPCYFLCNTNTTAVQRNQRHSDSMKDKESVVETMACCQGHPAVFSHWPNLVSFFLRVLSWFPSLWSQWWWSGQEHIKLENSIQVLRNHWGMGKQLAIVHAASHLQNACLVVWIFFFFHLHHYIIVLCLEKDGMLVYIMICHCNIICSNTVQHVFYTIFPSLCTNALSLNHSLAEQLSSLSSFTVSLKFHLAPGPHFKQKDDCWTSLWWDY